MHRFQTGMAKLGVSLLLLELFNYRLLPLYRYDWDFLVDDLVVAKIRCVSHAYSPAFVKCYAETASIAC